MGLVRILAFVEASTVTGPAKNLIEFCGAVRDWNTVGLSIATFTRGNEASEFTAAVRDAQIPLTSIPERWAFDHAVIGRIRSVVSGLQPDILQTHAVKSHFLMYLSGLWKTRPWVAFHHGYTTTDLKMRAYNQLDRLSLRKPARLVTVSRSFEQQLVGRGIAASRITVLQNAVDPRWAERVRNADRAEARRRLGVQPGESVLLAVGRMSQEKAHIDLIRAFHQLKGKGRAARLILVGDGPERPALEQAAGEGVVFTGQVRDTTAYYAAAGVMVLPSLTEGSPNVLLEAMAVDVPTVATEVGGIPEIVRHRESALLVPPQSPARLAEAIEEVLSNDGLRSSLIARARGLIAERHSPEARARALVDLYRGLLVR
jgi:glycosyltransferase involved in cell wall biosynthesis